jgi:hypothetical protein
MNTTYIWSNSWSQKYQMNLQKSLLLPLRWEFYVGYQSDLIDRSICFFLSFARECSSAMPPNEIQWAPIGAWISSQKIFFWIGCLIWKKSAPSQPTACCQSPHPGTQPAVQLHPLLWAIHDTVAAWGPELCLAACAPPEEVLWQSSAGDPSLDAPLDLQQLYPKAEGARSGQRQKHFVSCAAVPMIKLLLISDLWTSNTRNLIPLNILFIITISYVCAVHIYFQIKLKCLTGRVWSLGRRTYRGGGSYLLEGVRAPLQAGHQSLLTGYPEQPRIQRLPHTIALCEKLQTPRVSRGRSAGPPLVADHAYYFRGRLGAHPFTKEWLWPFLCLAVQTISTGTNNIPFPHWVVLVQHWGTLAISMCEEG